MCYTGGPRCSPHAMKNLIEAKKEGNPQAIAKAREEFSSSPAGIQALKAAGELDAAKAMQEKRTAMIARSKELTATNKYIKRQMEEFEGDPYHGLTLRYIRSYTEKYGVPEVGRTRAVFDMGDGHVIKVPLNGEGFMANRSEALTSASEDQFIPVAKCWQEDREEFPGGPVGVLIMEKVTPLEKVSYKELPDWVGYVDCGQVGYDKSGKLVAYDL